MHTPYQPHWSQTSSRTLNQCPRAWTLKYAMGPHGRPLHRKNDTTVPERTEDAVVHAMRRVMVRLFGDLHAGKRWSKPYLQQRLKLALDALCGREDSTPAKLHRSIDVSRMVHQLDQLMQTVSIRALVNRERPRWAWFERTAVAHADGITFYAAPDLAVYHQGKWTLIRIQMRSTATPLLSQDLEHALMVKWALATSGLPDDPSLYRLRVLRWNQNRWWEHQVGTSKERLQQAWELVRHDISEMKWMVRSANADPSLRSVPLAHDERICDSCRYCPNCPASEGLIAAREAQDAALLKGSTQA